MKDFEITIKNKDGRVITEISKFPNNMNNKDFEKEILITLAMASNIIFTNLKNTSPNMAMSHYINFLSASYDKSSSKERFINNILIGLLNIMLSDNKSPEEVAQFLSNAYETYVDYINQQKQK